MKHKIVQCFSRDIVEGKDLWVYPWKEWMNVATYGKKVSKHRHRIPWFLSLETHLRMEEIVEDLAELIFAQFPFKALLLPYDIVHGFICGYGMKEILTWWRQRT